MWGGSDDVVCSRASCLWAYGWLGVVAVGYYGSYRGGRAFELGPLFFFFLTPLDGGEGRVVKGKEGWCIMISRSLLLRLLLYVLHVYSR